MSTALTLDSIQKILGREVPEVILTAAKANAMGLDAETIAVNIGLEKSEVDELMESQDYKDIRLLIGADMLKDRTERDSNWDGIESRAVQKLTRRVEFENDTETLLKIATVANRATRRTAPGRDQSPLDPSQASHRIPLTLTRRYTEKLGTDGSVERTTTQQISVLNGSAINPKFEDVRDLLSGGSGNVPLRANPSDEELAAKAGRLIDDQKHTPALDRAQAKNESDEPFSMSDLLAAARRHK